MKNLRTLIREEIQKLHEIDSQYPDGQSYIKYTHYDKDEDCERHVYTNFRLSLGNNYRMDHFVEALVEEAPDIALDIFSLDLNDICEFQYKGQYEDHYDKFAVSDLVDYLKPLQYKLSDDYDN